MLLDRFSTIRRTAAAVLLLIVSFAACAGEPDVGRSEAGDPFDILILDARIVDGAGNPWFRGDVAVRGDRIAEVGHLDGRQAHRTIDARDRVVSPGFIDMMGQSSRVLVTDPPSAESKLRQGITTYLSGEGGSPAPQSEATLSNPPVVNGDTLRWRTYADYFAILEDIGIPINVVHDVGLRATGRHANGFKIVAIECQQCQHCLTDLRTIEKTTTRENDTNLALHDDHRESVARHHAQAAPPSHLGVRVRGVLFARLPVAGRPGIRVRGLPRSRQRDRSRPVSEPHDEGHP